MYATFGTANGRARWAAAANYTNMNTHTHISIYIHIYIYMYICKIHRVILSALFAGVEWVLVANWWVKKGEDGWERGMSEVNLCTIAVREHWRW